MACQDRVMIVGRGAKDNASAWVRRAVDAETAHRLTRWSRHGAARGGRGFGRHRLVLAGACLAVAIVLAALFKDGIVDAPAFWTGVPICRARGGTPAGFGTIFGMSLVMLLVSLAPLRWRGAWSAEGAVTAVLWVIGAGLWHGLILAADRLPPVAGGRLSAVLPQLAILMFSVAGALGASGVPLRHSAARDGLRCFLRCGPMMAGMMLTGAMSVPWMIVGGLMTQIDDLVLDRKTSRALTIVLGVTLACIIVRAA